MTVRILVVGDSTAAGDYLRWGGADAWPARIDPWRCRYDVVNAAVGGNTTERIVAALPALVAQHQPGEVWCLAGTNDFCHVHPDVVCGRFAQMAQQVVAAGSRWRQCTVTPTGAAYPWRGCHEPERAAVNSWARSYFGAPNVVDMDATLRTPGGVLDPVYDVGDSLHPNLQGHVRMADTARNALATRP